MAHYFFDLVNGSGLTRDEEGMTLDGLDSARQVALAAARALLAEELLRGEVDLSGKIIVRTKQEGQVMELGFEQAVEIRRPEQDKPE